MDEFTVQSITFMITSNSNGYYLLSFVCFLQRIWNVVMAAGGGGSFISKPARGWLHPDHLVSKEGITYAVKVISNY